MHELTPSMMETLGKLASRAMEARLSSDGRPFVIALFYTHHCPCKCPSCLWRHNDWEDVPVEDLKQLYREARELGFLATAISGGEPFLRKDLGEFVRFVKSELDMAILQFTTGWYLEERAEEILPWIDVLMMSLDSARAERHDEIRGRPGLFNRVMDGVDIVKARWPNLPIHFNVCVQKGVQDEIGGLVDLAKRLDVRVSFDVITEFRNAGDGKHFTETDMGLSLGELQEVCADLVARKRAGAPIVNSESYFQYFADGRQGYRCHFPKLAMCVDGRGYFEDCLNLDRPIAKVGDMPLKEVMELPRFKQLRKDAEGCSTCSSPTMVDMSRAWENPQILFAQGGISVGL